MPSILGRATTADGTALLTRHWPADEAEAGGAWAGAPWASVLLVHGLGEHSGRYEAVGDQMAASGIDVHAYDQRGQGGSDGPRGDIERWSQVHDDLAERLAAVREASTGRPVVLYGHSLGGLIVAGYCLTDRPKPDLVVLTSPALDSDLPAWKRMAAPVLGRVTPTLQISNGIKGEWLSRDPSVGAKTVDDPSCAKASTARYGAEAFKEQARVRSAAGGGLGVPTRVVHGEADPLVPVTASAIFDDAPLTTRVTYPNLRHETHNEPEGPEVVEATIAWLREQVAAMTRGTLPA